MFSCEKGRHFCQRVTSAGRISYRMKRSNKISRTLYQFNSCRTAYGLFCFVKIIHINRFCSIDKVVTLKGYNLIQVLEKSIKYTYAHNFMLLLVPCPQSNPVFQIENLLKDTVSPMHTTLPFHLIDFQNLQNSFSSVVFVSRCNPFLLI